MHRGLPEGNTKLVLILTRPCALSDHWARSSRIPSQCFCSDLGLRDPFVDVILATSTICMHMICQLNAHEIRIKFYNHKVTIDRV